MSFSAEDIEMLHRLRRSIIVSNMKTAAIDLGLPRLSEMSTAGQTTPATQQDLSQSVAPQQVANSNVSRAAPQPQTGQPANPIHVSPLPGPPGSVAQGPINNFGPLSSGAGQVALDGNHARGLPKQMGILG